jgi:pimeloyl-[acyl-carrier protein] methyl ester esterase
MNQDLPITLVLLPGLDGTGMLFRPFIDALPPGVHPLVIDYPPNTQLSLMELTRLVASRLPEGRIVLLAESFSGLVALTLLASRLRPIDAIVFCASFAEPPKSWLKYLVHLSLFAGSFVRFAPSFCMRRLCLGRGDCMEPFTRLKQALSEVSPQVLAHRFRLIATERISAPGRFDVPCYYLQAKHDHLVPSRSVDWFERHFKNFHLEEVDGPHFLLQAKPGDCARRVVTMVKRFL